MATPIFPCASMLVHEDVTPVSDARILKVVVDGSGSVSTCMGEKPSVRVLNAASDLHTVQEHTSIVPWPMRV